jgi:hypothetical protein
MKAGHFKELLSIPTLVRKYQARWEVCVVGKTCSYYWPEKVSLRNFKGTFECQSNE